MISFRLREKADKVSGAYLFHFFITFRLSFGIVGVSFPCRFRFKIGMCEQRDVGCDTAVDEVGNELCCAESRICGQRLYVL